MAEFALGNFNGLDFFDVSLVDGFNLPLLVVPSGQNCSSTGCIDDLNESCPAELEVTNGTEGKSVGCRSACDALGLPIYCCDGTSSSRDKCKPSLYSQFFKNSCPQGYSYVYDDNTNTTYTCPSTDYQITFCPGKSAFFQFCIFMNILMFKGSSVHLKVRESLHIFTLLLSILINSSTAVHI